MDDLSIIRPHLPRILVLPQKPLPTKVVTSESFTTLWGLLHVKKASFYIGILEIVLFAISAILFMFKLAHHFDNIEEVNMIVNLTFGGVLLIMVGIMFIGLKKENGNYLIPHLAWQVVCIIGLIVGLIFMFIYHKEFDIGSLILTIAFIVVRLPLQMYCFTVVYRCCEYFYDKPNNSFEPTGKQLKNEISDYDFWDFHPKEFY